jgi:hypothetical protein
MSKSSKSLVVIIGSILVLLWLGLGCEEDKGTDDGTPSGCTVAASLVDQANDSLGSMMVTIIDVTLDDPDSSFRPEDIDFTGVYDLYNQAATMCPSNLDAQFGAGFTGLLTYLADPELNDLIDQIKYLYDTSVTTPRTPKPLNLLPIINADGPLSPDAIPLRAGEFHDALPSLVALDLGLAELAADDPTISDIQNNLETRLLPKIIAARINLAAIINVPTFTFTITPAMQGNSGADPIILDRTDFSVMLAIAYSAEAVLHVFFARDLDFSEYSIAGVEEALNQGSTFLDLKGSGVGAGHIATAKARIASAVGALTDALDYLAAEIGTDQTYDLIPVPSGGASEINYYKDALSYYYDYLVNPQDIDVFINGKDTIITVDLKQFFDNPMNNPKDFLPDYTLTLDLIDSFYIDFAAMHFNREAYWDSLQSIYGISIPNDSPTFDHHLPMLNNEDFYRLIAEYSYSGDGRQQFIFGWDDLQNYCDPTNIWCYESNNMYDYSDYWYNPDDISIAMCYTWGAGTFAAWTWPDATFNGLFPGMTESLLKELTYGDGTGWQQSGCDTSDFFIEVMR